MDECDIIKLLIEHGMSPLAVVIIFVLLMTQPGRELANIFFDFIKYVAATVKDKYKNYKYNNATKNIKEAVKKHLLDKKHLNLLYDSFLYPNKQFRIDGQFCEGGSNSKFVQLLGHLAELRIITIKTSNITIQAIEPGNHSHIARPLKNYTAWINKDLADWLIKNENKLRNKT